LKVHYDADIDLSRVHGAKVAIIGYGSQGFAQANNLRDSGVEVAVGLRPDSASAAKVRETGIPVLETAAAAAWADAVMVLVPDHLQAEIYERDLKPGLAAGNSLMFAHGFNIHFGLIEPGAEVDVTMVAPKGPGHTVRRQYELGYGVPCLVAVANDASGQGKNLALAYAAAIGGARAGVIETNFREETETDLFGEQSVLCGGLTHLMQAGYETLVEAGYAPEMAYFETIHEVKLIVDLIYEGGMSLMRYSVSDTAEFGDYVSGERLIDARIKGEMKKILAEIQDGTFARRWMDENRAGQGGFLKMRSQHAGHQLEEIGAELRAMMPWIAKERLVDKSKN
jgi:ketol-acid reductoisomerase